MNQRQTTQYRNYLAIELLDQFGNSEPTQEQISKVEQLIPRAQLHPTDALTQLEIAYL